MSASAGCAAVDAGAHWVLTGGASMHDIAIRGGTIVDGAGKVAFTGDVAIAGSRIAAVVSRAQNGRPRAVDLSVRSWT